MEGRGLSLRPDGTFIAACALDAAALEEQPQWREAWLNGLSSLVRLRILHGRTGPSVWTRVSVQTRPTIVWWQAEKPAASWKRLVQWFPRYRRAVGDEMITIREEAHLRRRALEACTSAKSQWLSMPLSPLSSEMTPWSFVAGSRPYSAVLSVQLDSAQGEACIREILHRADVSFVASYEVAQKARNEELIRTCFPTPRSTAQPQATFLQEPPAEQRAEAVRKALAYLALAEIPFGVRLGITTWGDDADECVSRLQALRRVLAEAGVHAEQTGTLSQMEPHFRLDTPISEEGMTLLTTRVASRLLPI